MKKLSELQSERAVKFTELSTLAKDSESRELTSDEKTRFDTLEAEVREMDKDIAREEKAEQIRIQNVKDRAGKDTPEVKAAKRFSISRAVNLLGQGRSLDGIEAELDQEAANEYNQIGKGSTGNLRIPAFAFKFKGKNVIGQEQRDLTAAGTATGDELVEDLNVGHIFGLNVNPIVASLGATILPGLTGDVHFTKTGVATAVWASTENVASTETTPSTARITMTPKRVTAFVDLSKTLLTQKPGFVDAWITRELEVSQNVLLDQTVINGAGSGGAPTGLLNMSSGINSVVLGTDGATPERVDLLNMWKLVAEDNGDIGMLSFLTTPGIKSYLANKKIDAGSGRFIWEDEKLVGYPAYASNIVPSTLTKGASASICHAILLGVWDQLVIGNWGGMDITVDPFSRSKEFIVTLVLNSLWDINVRHQQAFCYIKDALATD